MDIARTWDAWEDADSFSGVFYVRGKDGVLFQRCAGFRNRSESLANEADTSFAIASGTKLFTGLATCKLVDQGKLALSQRLGEVLPYDLGRIPRDVTLLHLLTHTSGIGDYIDEEGEDGEDGLQDLYRRYPVYCWDRLSYYLPMISKLPPKFRPGARFSYSNTGFVMLGLAIEAVSGKSYQEYVKDEIIDPLGLQRTGFYRTDCLPVNTALGYIEDPTETQWRTNIFSVPVIGGSDGGLYTTAEDLDRLWRALLEGKILSQGMLREFLRPQVTRAPGKGYGLGVYLDRGAYYALGGDFGVDFFTVCFPDQGSTASALGNTEVDTYPLLSTLLRQAAMEGAAR